MSPFLQTLIESFTFIFLVTSSKTVISNVSVCDVTGRAMSRQFRDHDIEMNELKHQPCGISWKCSGFVCRPGSRLPQHPGQNHLQRLPGLRASGTILQLRRHQNRLQQRQRDGHAHSDNPCSASGSDHVRSCAEVDSPNRRDGPLDPWPLQPWGVHAFRQTGAMRGKRHASTGTRDGWLVPEELSVRQVQGGVLLVLLPISRGVQGRCHW